MLRLFGAVIGPWFSCLLLGSAVPMAVGPFSLPPEKTSSPADAQPAASQVASSPPQRATRARPKSPTVRETLDKGVLIVVSIGNQRVFVFRNGREWGSAPVSTGKRGHGTPVGVFPILQKSVAHRSTLYHDAPMPYMQRLTWRGVALHGGNVTRYRASHGCIRLPHAFARRLYKITNYRSTAVLITRSRMATFESALALVGGRSLPTARPLVELAERGPAPPDRPIQTIQLAATSSPQNAAMLWNELVERQPQLAQLQHQIIPANVNSLKVYRLRAFGPGAAAICRRAASKGMDCFTVAA
jgi:lipoprotein-anchoring transpeptidase ErfK/SrfK